MIVSISSQCRLEVQDQQATEIALQLSVFQLKDKEFVDFMHSHLGEV
jgi:hypothetical protein